MFKKLLAKKPKTNLWIGVLFGLSMMLVLGFFLVATLYMTMTGEDILHQNGAVDKGFYGTIASVYGFLPRVGEFFQRIVIRFYDYQTGSFNIGFLLRVIDAILCFSLIYLLTALSIGGRVKINLKNLIIFLSIFIVFITSIHNEIFMMRFSYLHNYIPILLSLTLVAYIMFYSHIGKSIHSRLAIAGGFLIGLIFGASNEIAPIAFLLLVAIYVFYSKFIDKRKVSNLISRFPTKSALVVGVVVGLIFLLSNGSIFSRGESAYGLVYDYVSISGLLSDTVYTLSKLLQHFIFNSRYLLLPLLAMAIFTLVELVWSKRGRQYNFVLIQLFLLAFALLYMLAAAQINVLDDLYPRFMSPVFLAVVVSFMIFMARIIDLLKPKNIYLVIVAAPMILLVAVSVVDLAHGFSIANRDYGRKLEFIKNNSKREVCVDRGDYEKQHKSPIFKFTQIRPFEEWTRDFGNHKIHGKPLQYSDHCLDTAS